MNEREPQNKEIQHATDFDEFFDILEERGESTLEIKKMITDARAKKSFAYLEALPKTIKTTAIELLEKEMKELDDEGFIHRGEAEE